MEALGGNVLWLIVDKECQDAYSVENVSNVKKEEVTVTRSQY